MGTQKHWDKVYAEKSGEAVSWYQREPALSLALIRSVAPQSDARIIDIGGGASTLVDHLRAGGYQDVSVLDIAASALAKARGRLGRDAGTVNWYVSDATKWTPPHRFDVWHDRAVFHFLTAVADRRAYKTVLLRALEPGGHAVITTFAMDGPEKCSGLPVVRYDAARLRDELGSALSMVDQRDEQHVTPGGMTQAFSFFLLRREP
ncbi:MAG: class I SAM-dependent methyltransferase [Rhodospirillaceae bacterium]|nr:class I SAM-dependent methyltransferase [Rhodospirillaceae bacterium]